MDPEKAKKRQSLKIVISEFIMVLTVILTVAVLALVVSGYWLNADFEVERQGMLQVSSVPAGADITIDGESAWRQRTNTSKVLSSGEHTVVLSKEGYDSWSKTINISEGLLYRLNYPRLFLKERKSTNLLEINNVDLATVSSDHGAVLLANNTTEWSYINLEDETLNPVKINIAPYFSAVSLAEGAKIGIFSGTITQADWDFDNSHVLLKVKNEASSEWILLDVRNPEKSVNLSREFGGDFTDVEILDNSANNLLAIHNNNLHKIDVSQRSLSAVLVKNVVDYDHFNNEIVFSAKQDSGYYVGYLKLGNTEIETVKEYTNPTLVAISRFYDEKYYTVVSKNEITIFNEDDYSIFKEYQLSFEPAKIKVGHQGEYLLLSNGLNLAALDMEANAVREWTIENERYGFIDNNMLYVVSDNELFVYDYDGFNRRNIAHNVSGKYPVAITKNKWLYYFKDNSLIREEIAN